MDTLEFISSLVNALAWPAAAVAAAILVRHHLLRALSGEGVRRWKAGPGGVEVEFWDRETTVIRKELLTGELAPPQRPPKAEGLPAELSELAELSPSAAVLEAYSRIESELRHKLKEADAPEVLSRAGGRQLARAVFARGHISKATLSAVEGLSVMRNLAAHGEANERLDKQRALEYLDLADAVLYALRSELR